MKVAFNFQARVQLTGPYNVQQVAQQISRQLSNVQAKVNLQVSSAGLQQIGQINSALYGFSGVAKRANADLQALNNNMYNFGEQAGLAARRFLAFSLAAGAITGIVVGLKNGVASAVQFQRELVRFDQISGDTQQAIRGVSNEVTRLATTFGVSSKELIQSATVLRQAGLTAKDTQLALEALSLAALSPNFGKMSENVEGLIAVTSQFNIKAGELKAAFGSINAVAGDYAVEAKDVIDATIRAGGAFATLGGNLNEFLAIFTTVRATTRESADTIATGLRTIFARLQQSDTVDALKDLQINLRHTSEEAARLGNINLTDQFVGPYEAIRRLSEGLKGLPSTDPRFAAVVEQIGGIRQISRVLPLLQQDKLRESVLRTAVLGTGSLQPGAEKAQEALTNKIDKTRESFEKLFRTIAEDKGFQAFARTILNISEGFAKALEYATPFISVLGTVATVKGVQSAFQFGSGAYNKFVNDKSKPYYNVRGFATGDVVPGTGNTDSVPANLMPGEFVFRKDAVKNIGIDNLRSLHQKAHVGAGIQHFAQGSNESVRRKRLLDKDELDPSYRKVEELSPLVQRLSSIYPNQPQSTSLLKRVRGGIDSTADYIKENLISTLVASVPLGIGAAASSNSLLGGIFNGIGAFAASAAGIGAAGATVTSGKAPDILGNTIKGIGSGIKGLAKKGFGVAYNFGAAGQNLDTGSSNDFLNELLGIKPTGNYALAEKNRKEIGLLANFFDGAFPTIGVLDWNQTDLNNNPHLREFAYKNPVVFQNKASVIRKQLKRGGELGLNTSGKLNELDNVLKDFYKMYAQREPYVAQLAQEPYLAQLADEPYTAELTPYPAALLPGKGRKGARDANIEAAFNYLDFNRGDTAGAIKFLQESTGLKESTAKRYVRTAAKRLGLPKFAEGGFLGGNIGSAIKKLTAVNKNNFAAVLAGLSVRFGGTNDDYIMEALLKAKRKEGEAVVSSYKPKGYAEGDSVVNKDNVISILKRIGKQTGINLPSFINKISLNEKDSNLVGGFYPSSRKLSLNPSFIKSQDFLEAIVGHEIGHALDYEPGQPINNTKSFMDLITNDLVNLQPKTDKKLYKGDEAGLIKEAFAEVFRLSQGIATQVQGPISFGSPSNFKYAEKSMERILGEYRGQYPRKFATGGGVGATDVVPAALTPGEFIFSREATSRIGVANLHRANKSGDISHIAGLTGFHKGGAVGRINLATGTDRPIERSNILDEVINSGFTFRSFNKNKVEELTKVIESKLRAVAEKAGLDADASQVSAQAKIESARLIRIASDKNLQSDRAYQNLLAGFISSSAFNPNSVIGKQAVAEFQSLSKAINPLVNQLNIARVGGTIVGQGKFSDLSLAPSENEPFTNKKKPKFTAQYYDNAKDGTTDTTVASLLNTRGNRFTSNSLRGAIEKTLIQKYKDEADAQGLYITQVKAQTKARIEATRIINLANSKEYAQILNDIKDDTRLTRKKNFKKLSPDDQNEVFNRLEVNQKKADEIEKQIALVTKGRSIIGVGDYRTPENPLIPPGLNVRARTINPVTQLLTSSRDNSFIQKLTGSATYNTSLTNLLASGKTESQIEPQLRSALESQLKREYEESGKAITSQEIAARSRIAAADLLKLAASEEVQLVNRRKAKYENLINSANFTNLPEGTRNRALTQYNVLAQRQSEINEQLSVRTQGGDIVGRGGVIDPNSDVARRQDRNYKTLLAAQIALPIISQGVNSFAGQPEANLNNQGRYTTARSTGGALEGGAIGATIVGSFIPGGAVVGGLLGALAGGIIAFVNAGEELRKAKLGETLTTLALNINTAAKEIEQNGRIGAPTRVIAQNTLREGISLLKPEDINQSSIGQALGAQRGLGQALSTLLEDDIRNIVAQNPRLSAAEIQQQLESSNDRQAIDFKGGSIQANRYQLLSLATTGDASSSAQRANFTQFISSLQRSLAAETVTRETNRIANAFGLLAGYIDKASTSFDKIGDSIDSSLNILSGRNNAERLRLPSDVSTVNPFSSTFGQNFNSQLAPFGSVGVQIGARANEFQALADKLPEVINDIFASGNVSGGGFRYSLDRRVGGGFSATQIGSQAQNIFDELSKDGKKSREEIQSGIIEQLGKQFQSIVPSLEKIINLTNNYATVLNEASKSQNEAIKLTLQANQAGLDVERINAQIRAVRSGRTDSFNFTSRAAFEQPFNANIGQLLAGSPFAGQNPNNLNIADIGRAFQNTISRSQDIRAGRPQVGDLARQIAGTLGGSAGGLLPGLAGTSSAFATTPVNPAAATQSLNKLAEQGNKYRQVLEAYTNTTARAARANEDLNQIRGDRQGRQNLASRFLSGGAQEQSEIFRGLGLIQNLRNTPGGLQGLGQESRALAISTLQGLGQTRLNIGGQRISADQYLQQEQERAFPGLFAQTNKDEEEVLIELRKINEDAKAAYIALGEANKVFSDKANTWAVDIFNKNSELLGQAAAKLNQISVVGTNQTTAGTPGQAITGSGSTIRGIADMLGLNIDGPFGSGNVRNPIITKKPEAFETALNLGIGGTDYLRRINGFADGGSVFKPKGTDTVPAMLTPGEFIVNAASTKANYSLLKQINNTRQPIYRQSGGISVLEGHYAHDPDSIMALRALPDISNPDNIEARRLYNSILRARNAVARRELNREYGNRRINNNVSGGLNVNQNNAVRLPFDLSRNFTNAPSISPLGGIEYRPIVNGTQINGGTSGNGIQSFNFNPVTRISNPYTTTPPIGESNPYTTTPPTNENNRIRLARGSYDSPAAFFAASLNNDSYGAFQRGNIRNVQGAQIASFLADSGNPFDRLLYGNQARSYQQRITEAGVNFRNLQKPNAEQLNNFRVANYRPARGFANGGFVGADTIPAMLSPGEFIVNSSATANNLPLLRSINDTRSPVYRAAGGPVGTISGSSDIGTAFNSGLTQALTTFGDSSKTLVTALQGFNSTANELAASIARFPTKMEVSVTHNVNVNHNGVQALSAMKEEMATLVIGETQKRLQDTFKTAFPDVNISFTGASIK